MRLFDSELKILEVLWEHGDTPAKTIIEILAEQTGWSRTTTYTIIKRSIDKGVISRKEPNFICHALISREEARKEETAELINRMYGGVPDQLVASLLGCKHLSKNEIKHLEKLAKSLK